MMRRPQFQALGRRVMFGMLGSDLISRAGGASAMGLPALRCMVVAFAVWQAAGGVIWFLYSTCLVGMTPTQWVAESAFGTIWGFVNMSGVLILFELLRKRWR
jgi:hypothetical protein